MSAPPDGLALHSSWRGRAQAAATPLLLVGLGAVGEALGSSLIPRVMLVVGVAVGIGVVWDYPLRVDLTARGITRVCPLRRQFLPWEDLTALARTPRPTSAALFRRPHRGGLVAERGRRRILLVDTAESAAEFDAVVEVLQRWAEWLPVRTKRPDDEVPPTWLYKRRRGRGEGLVDTW